MKWLVATACAWACACACGGAGTGAGPGPGATGMTRSRVTITVDDGTARAALADDPLRPLTTAECEEMVEHVIALEAADPTTVDLVPEERRKQPETVRRCVAEGVQLDYDCFMLAADLAAVARCNDQHEELTRR